MRGSGLYELYVPRPEMATVRVQVSWRGVLPEVALWPADRTVTVSAVAPLAKPPKPKVAFWPVTPWSEPPRES